MNEIDVIVASNTTWTCANCQCYITADPMPGWDGSKEILLYSPSSRYWAPGSKSTTSTAVYCRVECAQPHGETVARNPIFVK